MSAEQEVPNYPDLLGAITGGPRLNLDVVQGALAVRPFQTPAGQPFEVVFLLQNASDVDVDVVIAPVLPDKDAAGQKGQFSLKSNKLRIGLRPAEVGFTTLPILSSPQTKPARGYTISLTVEVKRMGKERPRRIREVNGGGRFDIAVLAEPVQKNIAELRALHFSADSGGKKNLARAAFEIYPAVSASPAALKPNWVSLWTLRDYMDEYTMAQKVWPVAQKVAKQLTRDKVFVPLLKSIQTSFQGCGYPLASPEAVFIAKLLTLVLEQGITPATSIDPRPAWPHWFAKLVKLLYGDEGLANGPIDQIATQLLFNEVVYDGIMQGFTMVGTVLNEDFGTPDETGHYATDIVESLAHSKPLDFARAYLPLILGGLIACGRVVMPGEQLVNTIELLSKTLENREREKNEDNDFIFDMARKLVVRAEDSLTGEGLAGFDEIIRSLQRSNKRTPVMVLQKTGPKVYPDVLGLLVEERTTLEDAVQCSFGIFPTMTAVDQPVEALLLLQNLFDQPLVLNIVVITPQRSASGDLLNFFTPKPRLSFTLPAAECGMLHLPIIAQLPTPPGKDYPVAVQIALAQKPDHARQIRPLTGGTKPNLLTISPFRLAALRDINFAASLTAKNQLETHFDVLVGQFPPRSDAPKPRYESLWTVNDLEQEQGQLQAVKGEALRFSRSLSRPQLHTPLLNLTRDIFGDAGIPLHPGEAGYIAKLMTYVASDGLDLEAGFSVAGSVWFEHLCQLMIQDMNVVQNPDQVLDQLYTAIVQDAVRLGFSLLSRETKADLGDEDEQEAYANKIVDALEGRLTLGLEHVYVPLVIAGTLLSGRVVIPGESPWRLLDMLKEARDGRTSLAGTELREVFDILNQMIAKAERALKELRIPRD